ncbi:TPA: hypothetical protein ACGQ50_000845 [Enterobacter cloacae]
MKTERNCPNCGIVYEADTVRLKHGRQTTCSRACSYALRAKNLENNIELLCPVCGKNFKRTPTQIKAKHGNSFCSATCHYTGRSLGLSGRICELPYVITEEGRKAHVQGAEKTRQIRLARDNYKCSETTKRKLSESTAAVIASGKLKQVSGLEDKVAELLTFFGVDFKRQVLCTDPATCVFDFLIGENIVLEVNGTFWHCDPRFYPSGAVSPAQVRNLQRYAIKTRIIADKGFKLLEIWEHDFKESPVNSVIKVINLLR